VDYQYSAESVCATLSTMTRSSPSSYRSSSNTNACFQDDPQIAIRSRRSKCTTPLSVPLLVQVFLLNITVVVVVIAAFHVVEPFPKGLLGFPPIRTGHPIPSYRYHWALPIQQLQQQSSDDAAQAGIGIGIDLGTTYSAVAYLKDRIPTIIPIPSNGRTMPSVVTFHNSGGIRIPLVGKHACERELELGGAYRNVKRVLGTGGKISADTAEVVPFVQPSLTGKTFKKDSLLNRLHDAREHPTLLKRIRSCVTARDNDADDDELVQPEDVSSCILKHFKDICEAHTGETVSRAVIGVPAYFNDAQRAATICAAERAGIGKVKLLREPEAAALAYGVGREQVGLGDDDEFVLVFDLGGGTYDVSMLNVGGGVTEIICTSGDAQLGGSVFDARIAQFFWKTLRQQQGVSTKKWSEEAKRSMVLAAESVRIYLSNSKRVNLALPLREDEWRHMEDVSSVVLPITYGSSEANATLESTAISNSTHALFQFTRKDMERLCKEEFQALLRPVREVAIMSGALLPGDSSPTIVEAALELEEEETTVRGSSFSFGEFYDESDAGSLSETDLDANYNLLLNVQEMDMKAAKKAQQRGRTKARNVAKEERKYRSEKRKVGEENSSCGESKKIKVRDGISGRPISRVVLVGGATRMPSIGRLLSALTGIVPQKTVNPDEAVALGCAVHVGVLDGVEGMGKVLSPMQSAILRAMAIEKAPPDAFEDEEEEFEAVEYY
jgi:molecular chaperone DnaK (HSP70)